MTDQSAQEPTMEEILASIRRIISEDDAPAETSAAAPAPAPEPDFSPEPASEPEPAFAPAEEPVAEAPVAAEPMSPAQANAEDDVLELTERYEAPAESIGDIDIVETFAEPEPAPAPAPVAEPAPAPAAHEALVSETAAASAASAFAGLAATLNKPAASASSAAELNFVSGNSVEAMVAEMLRPLLKDWLDNNLPAIVEEQVRKEVERIARSAG